MKKLINQLKTTLAVTFFLAASVVSAQNISVQRTDKVFFLNGDIKEGKVTGLMNEKIQFVHQGETLNYELNKREIEKIVYASGRTEIITEKKSRQVSMTPVNSKNRVAVMPMIYIGDDDDTRSEEMRFHLQGIAISYLNRSAMELKFMDIAEINALLFKNGINDLNIRQYTPKELAAILNVEYLIMGSVLQDRGSVVTVSNNHNTRRQTIEQYNRRGRHERYDRHGRTVIVTRGNNNGSSVTRQNIETQVSLTIYNEMGEMIYTRSRHSLLSEPDAYKYTIQYLLKRTPLYER
jgi:hypothetical protein